MIISEKNTAISTENVSIPRTSFGSKVAVHWIPGSHADRTDENERSGNRVKSVGPYGLRVIAYQGTMRCHRRRRDLLVWTH